MASYPVERAVVTPAILLISLGCSLDPLSRGLDAAANTRSGADLSEVDTAGSGDGEEVL